MKALVQANPVGATSTLIAPLRSVAKLAMGTHTEAKFFVRVALAAREFLISITKPSLEERRKELQVSVLLCTVTLYANLAHSLTRSP
mgnify:CR=1 FL=1|jgi:hypothetical protein